MVKEKKEVKSLDFFKTKRVIGVFAIASLIFGFLFIRDNSITGNAILNSGNSSSLIQVIGVLLILCSLVLGTYALKEK